MTTAIYTLLILLSVVLCGALFAVIKIAVMKMPMLKKNPANRQAQQAILPQISCQKSAREAHFTALSGKITPRWFWRVNHEYLDFYNSTIGKMSLLQLTDNENLFNAQRRCSDLNAAISHYYSSLKKRCLGGEQVPVNDMEVLNLRHCFEEFTFKAYPELVALVWPEYRRPQLVTLPCPGISAAPFTISAIPAMPTHTA